MNLQDISGLGDNRIKLFKTTILCKTKFKCTTKKNIIITYNVIRTAKTNN